MKRLRRKRNARLTLGLSALLCLTACTTAAPNASMPAEVTAATGLEPLAREVQDLFEQPELARLGEYLARYQQESARAPFRQQVQTALAQRCIALGTVAAQRIKHPALLAQLQQSYATLCPAQVAAVAKHLPAAPTEDTGEETSAAPDSATLAPDALASLASAAYTLYLRNTLAACHTALQNPQPLADALIQCGPLAWRGDAALQNTLGTLYWQATPPALTAAAHWFERAAAQGNADAQFNLGVMYASGKGLVQDDRKAARWFQRAARQGSMLAQYNLGLMCLRGQGVAQHDEDAFLWFSLAVQQGSQEALIQRDRILQRFSPAQRELAQQRLNDWTARQNVRPAPEK